MSLTLIPQSGFCAMPWKNGGGTTIEIAASPHGAGLDRFDWRVSMARVEGSGPFSVFEGIDRCLCVLSGAGIVLKPFGRGHVTLTQYSPPYAFPADLALKADVLDGPITDLNVMTRRGRARAFVSRLIGTQPLVFTGMADVTLMLLQTDCHAVSGNLTIEAGSGDVLRLDGRGSSCTVSARDASSPLSLFLIELWQTAQG
jgi:environmental stress-induced protein Ves